jgi:hypothetical protein
MTTTPLRLLLPLLTLTLSAACGGGDDDASGDLGTTIDAGDTGGDDSDDSSDDGDDAPPPACADTCDGCCDGETCLSGDASDACGLGGNACAVCGPDFVCGEGACSVDPASRWDVLAVRATVFEDNSGGGSWDPLGGLPDVFLNMRSEDSPEVFEGESTVIDDTLAPEWNQVILEDVPARGLTGSGLQIELLDSDLAANDAMGRCDFAVGQDAFGEGELVAECGRNDEVDPPVRGWSLTWRLRRN